MRLEPAIIIRPEKSSDIQAITDVTIAAFTDHPYSHNTEQFIISALRAAGALTLSLVAEVEGRVVGHVAFSPVTISGQDQGKDLGWYGVGPVSVLPELQRQGIGQALMREGLRQFKAAGAKGCALVGDPNYYQRFGFRNIPDLVYEGVPPENFVVLPLGDEVPSGVVVFHEGFHATA